jgi:uncharacterized membrane protein YhaH (DUF805 family)
MAMSRPRREPTVLWALTGFDGRVDRQIYWLGNIMCGLIAVPLMNPSVDPATDAITFGPLSPFVFVALIWTEIALAVKRLHDRGLTGWIAATLMVPFLNIAAFVAIGLMPGDKGRNAYGPATNSRGSV